MDFKGQEIDLVGVCRGGGEGEILHIAEARSSSANGERFGRILGPDTLQREGMTNYIRPFVSSHI